MHLIAAWLGRGRPDERRYARVSRDIWARIDRERYAFSLLNISPHGVSGRCDGPAVAGKWIDLEFDNGIELRGVVRWTRDGVCGIEFFTRQLDPPPDYLTQGRQPRPPRFHVKRRAQLELPGRRIDCTICNVSEDGMQIELGGCSEITGRVRLTCGAYRGVEGVVRWQRGERLGLRLMIPIDLGEFEKRTGQASLPHTTRLKPGVFPQIVT